MRSLDPATVSRWAAELAARGLTPTPLAAGVEGAVFRLGNGSIAKVWDTRTEAGLHRLAAFYQAVAGAGLPFLTPEISEIGLITDATFSIERELPGRPLFPDRTGQSPPLEPRRRQRVADVLLGLASVTTSDAMRMLPILDEADPVSPVRGFDATLGELVARRVEHSLTQMSVAIPAMSRLAAMVVSRLSTMGSGPEGLIHGDLIPANILVDDDGAVAAVLDFGFLTTVGPLAFDAAVAVAVFDMYGPHRGASFAEIDRVIREAFGYPEEVLAVYRAAYAMVTMTKFGSSEEEGHFRWCAEMLRRPDVLNAL